MCRYHLWIFACGSLAASSFQVQTAPPNAASQQPTIKSEVRIVLVDVVVTRGNGGPVPGLLKEDFQIAEDGRTQTISFFEEHKGGSTTAAQLPPMPPDVFTNYPTMKTTDSVNVLLLDSLNTQAVDQTYVRPQMAKYLQAAIAAPNGARLAIFTLGQKLRMVRGFTADSSGLLTALTDPQSGTQAKYEPQLATPRRKDSEQLACMGIRSSLGQAACLEYMAEENAERNADRGAMTLQAFQALARYLAPIPGRKNVMWVAGSFPIHFFPDTGVRGKFSSPYQSDVQRTANLLTADQVAVYPISAKALDSNTIYDSNNFGKPIEADESDRSFNQIAMELLARDTGGRAFYNTNDLSAAMATAVEEGTHFYTLTYAPTNTKLDGKLRHIELKLAHGDYKLAYRRGYYAESPKRSAEAEDHSNRDALAPLMGFGMPDFAQILCKVKIAPAPTNNKVASGAVTTKSNQGSVPYGFDFAIAPADLLLEAGPDKVRRGSIEVMIVAYDAEGAQPCCAPTPTSG
jgi:VWFA-related protein